MPLVKISPTAKCTIDKCTHQRCWHNGKSKDSWEAGDGKCTHADCPCTSGQYPPQ